jgi:prepilin-type N-terminal cleavage/methylation domain-containing protein
MSRLQKGFTIIELMIATMVFSVILIVITTAIIQIGHIYYKGVTSARTQEAARGIIDDISRSIQMSGGTVTPSITNAASGAKGFCVNQRRYSYVLDKQLTDSSLVASDQTKHALVVDEMNSQCTGATSAQDITNAQVSLAAGSDELLGPNMRLAKMSVTGSGDLYTISVRVVYGDTDLLTSDHMSCVNQSAGSQFCAVSELNTTVQKRVQ